VFEKLIEQLTNDEDYNDALAFVPSSRGQFPDKKSDLLEKEIQLLVDLSKDKEAARVYITAFDPFWTKDESEKFLQISERERSTAGLHAGAKDPGSRTIPRTLTPRSDWQAIERTAAKM
jgi:hypothetical protein